MSVTQPANSPNGRFSELGFLDSRRSVPARQLGAPGPDDATVLRMLQSASRVPDHGRRVPFRFVRIAGDARLALGEALAALTIERDPQASDGAIEKDRQRFAHAPLVIAVLAILDPDDRKIPETERLLSAGAACFALLQAAQALGFGANWLTGWPAHDPQAHALLGMGEHERVVGFVHIGTPMTEVPERERPDAAALLTDWTPG
ncbi:nitroreductase [Luteimonas soli]|uniref:Putative NAD(P)H nitroreductase n=1 Tax=Luteimonas soli TaxID=1648966 RepID=A0ABV7XIY1_9GAMM